MSSWHPPCYQRATAYLTDPAGRLAVFVHVDAPEAGTQVPAGGILPGEGPEAAVMRELTEESGIDAATLVRKLGETWYVADPGNVPTGKEEQIQHAFHVRLEGSPAAEEWDWDERSGGDVVEHRFRFRWVSLDEACRLLWPVPAMWIDTVRRSLRHAP
jgi:8-oxo-dGTP pyrophosphatase MutT (NUDIX family)